MDGSDIFGEDVRDSSHLQIVSSDEEEDVSKSPINKLGSGEPLDNLRSSKEASPLKSIDGSTSGDKREIGIKSGNNVNSAEKLDRQFRLDRGQDTNGDTQNIIDEINKMFEEKDEVCEGEEDYIKGAPLSENGSIVEKGKKIINRLKKSLLSEDGLNERLGLRRSISITNFVANWCKKGGDNRSSEVARRSARVKNRIIGNGMTNIFNHNSEDVGTDSSSSYGDEDDDYDPEENVSAGAAKRSRSHVSKTRTNQSKGTTNTPGNTVKRKASIGRRRVTSAESMKTENQESTSIPFNVFLDVTEGESEPQERMLCLKFAVVNERKEAINDSRLESVYIKSSETIGNIAKKLGAMYKLDQEEYGKIRIIIDGEAQNHNLQIGDPELCVEDKMQIDVKFPSREDLGKVNLNRDEGNKSKRSKKVSKRCVNVARRNQGKSKSRPQSRGRERASEMTENTDSEVLIID